MATEDDDAVAKAAADAEAARIVAEANAAVDDSEDDDKDDDKVGKDDDWQVKSRKNESRAKKAERERALAAKERDELKERLSKIEAANLSEQEKAIAKAREEAASEITTKYEAERRTDRIENAVTKLSLQGFEVGDGDKKATLKFADPDDAQLRLDRALRNGDLTYDEIYADGRVQRDAITAFLTDLLEEHPRLRAETGNGHKQVVDMDGGKGSGAGKKSLTEMTPDDHLKEIQSAGRG
jgi:hypothetical protein